MTYTKLEDIVVYWKYDRYKYTDHGFGQDFGFVTLPFGSEPNFEYFQRASLKRNEYRWFKKCI